MSVNPPEATVMNFVVFVLVFGAVGFWCLLGLRRIDRPSRICRMGFGIAGVALALTHVLDWIGCWPVVGFIPNVIGLLGLLMGCGGFLIMIVRLGNRPFA